MPTHAPIKSGNFKLAPEGTHVARCIRFIHIGTIPSEWQGQVTDMNKISLTFELPNELHVFKEELGEQPISVSQEYTLSLGEKANLRKLVEGIAGKMTNEEAAQFDVESLVGMACLITVHHKTSKAGNERAEIASAAPLLKGMVAPAQVNPSKILNYDNFDTEFFDKLPNFLKDKIRSSQEFKKMVNGDVSTLSEDDKKKIAALREGAQESKRTADEITSQDIPF